MALDKNTGVRPVGIGEAIRRLMAKLVHTLTTTQAMKACGTNNLCGRLKAGMKEGPGGPSGADSSMLKDWFGAESEELREELEAWT